MGSAGILFVRRSVSDVAVNDDQCRAVLRALKISERAGQHLKIVCVADSRHVPAVGHKTRGHVLSKRQGSVALDRDVVVVVNPTEICKLQVPGERSGFAGDAFHHASVSAERVHVEVEQILKTWDFAVVTRCQPLTGNGHSNTGCDALSQRSGGSLNPRCPAVLRMSRTAAIQLAECLDGVERYG